MITQSSVDRGTHIIEELSDIIRQMSDNEVHELLGTGSLDKLLIAILDPSEQQNYPNLDEFLLAKKVRATLLAKVRNVITQNYALSGKTPEGKDIFVSPNTFQWFEDGVLFLQGEKPFEGFLGLYRRDGSLTYAVVARDSRPGEPLGPEHFEFVDQAAFRERLEHLSKTKTANLDEPIKRLEMLLLSHDNDESDYQEWLIAYPWVLGAEYDTIQRHTQLDDRNIPDFTGVRVRDRCRDIIEIKPPFTKMFRDDGTFNADFNDAWNQAERYFDFAREARDYLYQQKGLRFENPKCYLILGFNLTDNELREVHRKERLNPAIHLRTYNDLLTFAKGTVTFLRQLRDQGAEGQEHATTE